MAKSFKFILVFMVLFSVLCSSALGAEKKQGAPLVLQINGAQITTDVNPVVIKDRTLVPIRVIVEGLGGNVNWDQTSKMVTITTAETTISLTVGVQSALVNGETIALDTSPLILQGRTMIPIRFVAESLSYMVEYDSANSLVNITAPVIGEDGTPLPPPVPTATKINLVKLHNLEATYQIGIYANGQILNYKTEAVEHPHRLIVEIAQTKIPLPIGEIKGYGSLISAIRVGQYTATDTRVVIDLTQAATGEVHLSEDKKTLYVTFAKTGSDAAPPQGVGKLPALDAAAAAKLVVVEAGHGGNQPGSSGSLNGTKLLEKDINLEVALRVNQLLKQAGVRTYMMRETDVTIDNKDRTAQANFIGADLYLCLHNNSFSNPSANGTETLWNNTGKDGSKYGITSKRLAEITQKQLTQQLALTDRGLQERPNLTILKYTQMPAILIEGAFLSNPDNLQFMLTPEFKERMALAAASGIILGLNEMALNAPSY